MKDLLAYLYGGSQVEAEADETREAIERIMEEAEKQEPLKPKRTPLVAALKSLGLDDVNDEIEYDTEGFVLVCDEEDEYKRYVKILMEPEGMEKLAELGWVVTRCGDVAMSNELPEFRIRFLEITTADSSEDGKWPAPNPELIKKAVKKGREFMDEPGPHDEESPVEYDDKTSSDRHKGIGKEKDGADPEGKPKGSSKKESLNLVDKLLSRPPVEEGRHKQGCQCGFCKNMGKGFKKKDGGEDKPKEEPKEDGSVTHGFDSNGGSSGSEEVQKAFNEEEEEPPRFDDFQQEERENTSAPRDREVAEELAVRRGRPKHAPKDKPVAKAPKASMKVAKAYKTPKK